MNDIIKKYLAEIGSRGGRKSRRTLTREQAQAMVAARKDRPKLTEKKSI